MNIKSHKDIWRHYGDFHAQMSPLHTSQVITRNACETCMPPSLNVTVTLTFDLESPNSVRGHLLVMTNHHTKLEDPWAMSSLVIDQTRFVY